MASTKTSVLTACFLFGTVVAYALGAPATYQSRAMIAVERETRERQSVPVRPLESAKRLSEALGGVDVSTLDGQAFTLSCRAPSAAEAEQLCTRASQRALVIAPGLSAAAATEVGRLAQRRAAEELAAFATAHAELLEQGSLRPAATVVEEWQRKIRSVREAKRESGPIRHAHIVQNAQLPNSPNHPNRQVTLALGAIFAVLSGLLVNALPRRQRRADSIDSWEATPLPATEGRAQAGYDKTPKLTSASVPPPAAGAGRALAAERANGPTPPQPQATPKYERVSTQPGLLMRPASVAAVTNSTLMGAAVAPALAEGVERSYRFVADAPGAIDGPLAGRSTAILGSFPTPLPPEPPAEPRATSSRPPRPQSSVPPRATSSGPPRTSTSSSAPAMASSKPPLEASGARYSYVSTPAPPGEIERVREHVTPHFQPDASLRPEACRDLRRELFAFGVRGCFVMTVSASSEHLAAKSRFSAELALALAETGHARVLLLEGNPEYPSVHALMKVAMPTGLGLSAQLAPTGAVSRGPRWHVVRCTASLSVLAEEGPGAWDSLRVAELHTCLLSLRQEFDFVVISGPTTTTQRAYAVAGLTDGVLLVSTTSDSTAARRDLAPFGVKRLAKVIASS